MFSKLRPRSVYDVMAAIACFGVLAGGTAYATDTVFSTDIKDGEVMTPDLANLAVTAAKLNNSSVGKNKVAGNAIDSPRIVDNSVGSADIANGTVGSNDLAPGGVTCSKFNACFIFPTNFGTIASGNCARAEEGSGGFSESDNVLVTPPGHFADTFTITAKVDPDTTKIAYVACNVFGGGGAADPDGANGGWFETMVLGPP
jgi:hypothetical protein